MNIAARASIGPSGRERIHQTFSTARLVRRWLDTAAAKLQLRQFQDTRPLERQTIHALVDRYVHEEMQTRDNDRKGHIPSILQDEIAQLPLIDLPFCSVITERTSGILLMAEILRRATNTR
ncbi:MAG: hypothetical protein ABF611_11460 [Acetobacter orientalis]|uniref:hypothetical protein n=1 Tax=Acetobacter orientalis TaxID=146474 RepID=UPI0039E91000